MSWVPSLLSGCLDRAGCKSGSQVGEGKLAGAGISAAGIIFIRRATFFTFGLGVIDNGCIADSEQSFMPQPFSPKVSSETFYLVILIIRMFHVG